MKSIFTVLLLCLGMAVTAKAQQENPNYNKVLADSLGADDYGMKSYILVILKTGENDTANKEQIGAAFRGHMDNISKMVEMKKLIVAGPLGKNPNSYRGIFIFDVRSIEEAEALVETDPAVKAKLLAAEYYEWYGSAALPLYMNAAKEITKTNP